MHSQMLMEVRNRVGVVRAVTQAVSLDLGAAFKSWLQLHEHAA